MQPFAQQKSPKTPMHWWLTSAAAVIFFVWCFDLIPWTKSVQTGRLTTTESSGNPQDLQSSDWSDISGLAGGLPSTDADGGADGVAGAGEDEYWSDLKEPESVPTEPVAADLAAAESDAGDLPDAGDTPDADEVAAAEETVVDEGSPEEMTEPVELAGGRRRGRVLRDEALQQASYTPDRGARKTRAAQDRAKKSSEPAILPADFAEGLLTAKERQSEGEILEAHALLSELYWKHAEHRELLMDSLQQTSSAIFLTADEQFGEPHFVEYGETLESIGREYEVPWQYLARLNEVTPEKLQAGQQLKVVRGPFGAVVDLSRFTLTVHAHGWYVRHYSIGIGRDEKTPTGKFEVQEKLENPVWYDPDGGVVEADDPQNPLGEYWLGLGNHIGIHGTIDPASIGAAASRGCIHLGDTDIREVYELLGTGSEVTIRR
jgi:lipoprotein-anchoring transpeptidase ErfK/SrfK